MLTFFTTYHTKHKRYLSPGAKRDPHPFIVPQAIKLPINRVVHGRGGLDIGLAEIDLVAVPERGRPVVLDAGEVVKLGFLIAGMIIRQKYEVSFYSLQRFDLGIENCILEVEVLSGLSWRREMLP